MILRRFYLLDTVLISESESIAYSYIGIICVPKRSIFIYQVIFIINRDYIQ